MEKPKRYVTNVQSLPKNFPTHLHSNEFWEALGRVVATFGFLEETLGKAIFSFTATREFPENQIDAEFEKWLPTLQRALSDPLGGLIDAYGKAVRDNKASTITNLDVLLEDLRKAAAIRNVICHGSWRAPDTQGRSVPFFVDKQNRIFDTKVDFGYLHQVRLHALDLTCTVINSVTHMGWQFPGSNGPGNPIVQRQRQ
ncbi:MAG: hypothetical protein HOP13_19105 [Alphaproteobacteria bacterium]|nr:hypothetical protein [Alphaproteobacteria bacterium]